jgi:transcriptional regulator with XRE-family HTH domain
MIEREVINDVKRLLAEGSYSQRKIADMTGVSRSTVGAIATGKRRDHDARANASDLELETSTGPPRRCPGCGGLVFMPCRLCHVRKLIAESRIAPQPHRPNGRLELELLEGEWARYERVRRGRPCA